MKEDRIFLLEGSLNDIEKEISQMIHDYNSEGIKYNFLRMYRLLGKIDQFLSNPTQRHSQRNFYQLIEFRKQVQQKIGMATAQFANSFLDNGLYESAEREWLAAISILSNQPEYYVQYVHAAFRQYGLAVEKDISDNMKLVNKYNVIDICACLKRARFAIKSAVAEEGIKESTGYILTWLDLLEREISNREDLIQSLHIPREEITLEVTLNELNQLIGLKNVKRKIKEISDWVNFSKMRENKGLRTDEISLHMIFSGNPGTGKTTVARVLAKIYQALGILKRGHLVEATRSDLVAEYVGQTAIKTMKKIKEAEDGVLFIDEAYSLFRTGGGNDFGIEAIDTLVKAMEDKRKNLVVVLAGYPNEMEQFVQANPGIYSRFKFHIHFPDYSIEELMLIHYFLLEEKQYRITEKGSEIVRTILERRVREEPENHGNGRLVRNLIEDEILNKASYVVELDKANNPVSDLDLIDENIMKMVEVGIDSDVERRSNLNNRVIGYTGKE